MLSQIKLACCKHYHVQANHWKAIWGGECTSEGAGACERRLSHISQMADVASWGEAHSQQEQATETCVPACGESFSQWVAFMTGQPENGPSKSRLHEHTECGCV